MINYDDSEPNILSFYNIGTLNPTSLDDLKLTSVSNIQVDDINNVPTEEQYNLLEKLVNGDSGHNSNDKYKFDDEDREDPLKGLGTDIGKLLHSQGLISSMEDPELTKFLISSQNFDSHKFLTVVHSDTKIESLIKSLSFLEHDIEKQRNQLKSVIDENFMNFVSCKSSIDDVLLELKNSKTRSQMERDSTKIFNPSKIKRFNSKQETLLSDLEDSIKNLNVASNLMMRPILDHKNKEGKLNKLIDFIKNHQFFFDLPKNLIEHLSNHDHENFINDYHVFLDKKRDLLELRGYQYKKVLSKFKETDDEQQLQEFEQEQLLISSALTKVFTEVDKIIAEYRKKTYKELLSVGRDVTNSDLQSNSNSKFVQLIDKIYQLREIDNEKTNPIFEFLNVQVDSLENDLDYQMNKFDSKFSTMQKKLATYIDSFHADKKTGSHVSYVKEKFNMFKDYLKATSSTKLNKEEEERLVIEVFEGSDNLDLSVINETWLILSNFVTYMDGIYSEHLERFTKNYCYYMKQQATNQIDIDGAIQAKFTKVVEKIVIVLVTMFHDDSGEVNQLESSPTSYTSFMPLYTNSLSAAFYLGNISASINAFLTKVGNYVGMVGNAKASSETNKVIKSLRNASAKINQKVVEALCAVWVNDCSQFYEIEKWQIHEDDQVQKEKNYDEAKFTDLVKIVECFQLYLLSKISRIVYVEEKTEDSEIRIVSSHPSKRTLVSLEIQFMRSMNVIVDSMMKSYTIERSYESSNSDMAIYKILAMNNFDRLSISIFPRLILKFDSLFDKNLSKQNLKIFESIDKINETVFQDVLEVEKAWLSKKLNAFFSRITKLDNRKESNNATLRIDGVIYEVLVHLVHLVHTVKPLTSLEIFVEIENELQEAFLREFLSHLRNLLTTRFPPYVMTYFSLDINFFMEIFESSNYLKLNEKSMELVNITLDLIHENEEKNYTESEFESILVQNLKDSQYEFDCLL